MPTIYDLKPHFQVLLRPVSNHLATNGFTPNQITMAAMVLSIAAGLLIVLTAGNAWPILLVPAVLLIRMALNAIDGMLAREHAMQTFLGAVLNELGDVLSDAALYLPFALIPGINAVFPAFRRNPARGSDDDGLQHQPYGLTIGAAAFSGFGHGRFRVAALSGFLTQSNDVAQFLWGKALGRRKIVPNVSPNKTLEGFLGGVATTTFIAVLLSGLLTPLCRPLALLAGILISMAGFVGDVTMSAIKRDIGVKDSGTLLPGHGGILDRIDSLTYSAPLFFHFTHYLYY